MANLVYSIPCTKVLHHQQREGVSHCCLHLSVLIACLFLSLLHSFFFYFIVPICMPSWYFLHSYISCLCLCYLCFVHTTDEDGSSAVETFGRIIMTSLKSIVTKMGCQSPHITGIVGGGGTLPPSLANIWS